MGLRIIPRCSGIVHSLLMFETCEFGICIFAILLRYQLEMHQHDALDVVQNSAAGLAAGILSGFSFMQS